MKQWDLARRGFLGAIAASAALSTLPQTASASTSSRAKLFFTETGTGRNIMLLHGWTVDANDWSWQISVLEQRNRVIAVDLRGHGQSEVPASGYGPSDYVRDIERLMTSAFAGQKFILIGHSMGGQIAARLAAKRPDLIDAVVSIDGSLGFADDVAPLFCKVSNDLEVGDPGTVIPELWKAFYDPATPPAFQHWHARRVKGMPKHVVRQSFGPLFLGPDQVGVGAQSQKFLSTLNVPLYHLCRDESQANRMRSVIIHPKSKVDFWTKTGHWIMQDRPDDVNAAIVTWLDRI
ncbi:MAG: alpha/beta hydrolase [Telmatospirillum sp.]|nr:alpha/beta hydrolase [Telmatospirillum sp.]